MPRFDNERQSKGGHKSLIDAIVRNNYAANRHQAGCSHNGWRGYQRGGHANAQVATCDHRKTPFVADRPHPPFGETTLPRWAGWWGLQPRLDAK